MDILKPEISKLVGGVKGKSFFFYGNYGTGKTSQSVKAERPYVLSS